MENPEQSADYQPEKNLIPEEVEQKVPYQEIEKVVSSLKFTDYEMFEFFDETNLLIFCPDGSGEPIDYHPSTVVDGIDIYIWESIRSKGDDFLRAGLMHELAERAIDRFCFQSEKPITSDQDDEYAQKSHELAMLYEEKYKLKHMDSKQRREFDTFFQQFRERGSNK